MKPRGLLQGKPGPLELASLLLATAYTADSLLILAGSRQLGELLLLLITLASLASASRTWSDSYKLVMSGSLVGFTGEYLGLRYGFPFGRYEYLKFSRASILGVPIPIIFAWGIYLYTSYLASMYLCSGRRCRVLATGIMMVALDLSIDPVMVSRGFWRWLQPGPWFDVPLENFLGWFTVSLVACLFYSAVSEREPMGRQSPLLLAGYIGGFLPVAVIADASLLAAFIGSFALILVLATLLRLEGLSQSLNL